jgi:undecaprenyl-diphosphatase
LAGKLLWISLLIATALTMALVDYPLDLALGALDAEHFTRVRQLTDIGDSANYLIPIGIALPLLYLLRQRARGAIQALSDRAFSLFLFVFTAIALSGILVNVLKVAIGRGRPRTIDEEGWFAFQPFAFDSDFASLPSGHANTVFVLATLPALALPRWRILIWSVAAWLALTRVLIGAHFFADIILGAALGIASTLWLRDRFERLEAIADRIEAASLNGKKRILDGMRLPPSNVLRS